MAERTEHGQERHQQEDRPKAEAFHDREHPAKSTRMLTVDT
jgi:hypothetical protein